MNDLISRQAVMDILDRTWVDGREYDGWLHKEVEDIPSAERTGRWTHAYDENEKLFFKNKWVCSACGKSNTYGMSDFCPHCGERMENSTRRTKEAEKIKCLM